MKTDLIDRERIAKWAAFNGVSSVGEFRAGGISGSIELVGRLAMVQLLGALAARGVRTVVAERADRFARDLVVSELLLREFSLLGVRVFEAEGGNDLSAGDETNPTAKLVRQILGAVAEFDKTSIVLKLRAARSRHRFENGRCAGRQPIGGRDGEEDVLEAIRSLWRKPDVLRLHRSES